MDAIDWVRRFFQQQLSGWDEDVRRLRPDVGGSPQHLVAHLVDRTVRRAVLDAVAHTPDYSAQGTAEVSWKHCLMVAALTELRSVKMLARNGM
jgi:hypothetical protein